jgi:predicted nuclease of restriction endonuclease-like (RecB) superfamily
MAKKFGWTKEVLIHQIENKSHEKYLLNQTNFEETLPEKYKKQAILAVKDAYQFGFLELADQHSEYELEAAIIKNIREFLLEMGGYFSFIGNQFRLEVGEQEYFIDLLLFHRKLACLVALELKIGKFTPEMVGKMQFYLSVLNDTLHEPHENHAIGIIVCKSKNSRTANERKMRLKRLKMQILLKVIDHPVFLLFLTSL